MANVESGLELSHLKLGANVESGEKLIIRVDFLLVKPLARVRLGLG